MFITSGIFPLHSEYKNWSFEFFVKYSSLSTYRQRRATFFEASGVCSSLRLSEKSNSKIETKILDLPWKQRRIMKKQLIALFSAIFLICCYSLFVFNFDNFSKNRNAASTSPTILLSHFPSQIEAPPLAMPPLQELNSN